MGAEPLPRKRGNSDYSGKRRFTDVSLQSLALAQNLGDIPVYEGIKESIDEKIANGDVKIDLDARESPWFSLWLANVCTCMCGIQFSIYMMSMWPYLHSLDNTTDLNFLGWIIASYSVGQAIASPAFGIWNQRTLSTKYPLAVGLVFCIAGNLIYALLPNFPSNVKWIMLGARFIIGVGSGNYAVLRSYTASASVPKDRDRATVFNTGAYVLGISFGPAIQCVINMISLVLLFTAFKEDYAGILSKADRDANEDEYFVLPKYDYVACAVLIYMFFILNCVSTLMETLSSPLTIALYDFNDQQVVEYSGIAQALSSVIELINSGVLAFTAVGKIDKRISLLIGLAFFALYHLIILPWPFYTGKLDYIDYTKYPDGETTDEGGCYKEYRWCETTPRVPQIAYWTGYLLGIGFGFPYMANPTASLFSEVIGPRNQGNLQGIMALFGSLARVVAPIFSTYLFQSSGYLWPMVIELVILAIGMVSVIVTWKRLVPLKIVPEAGRAVRYKLGKFVKL